MNPYESPQDALPPNSRPADARPRFRWRIVPAVVSWGIGGLYSLSPLAAILLSDDDEMTSASPLFLLLGLTLVCGSGLAWVFAGGRWMAGRWWQAVALNLVPLLLFAAAALVDQAYAPWIKCAAMNPYDAPRETSEPRAAVEAPKLGFRWRLLPAILSWALGGFFLLSLPLGVYVFSQKLLERVALPYLLMPVVSFVFVLTAGLCWILAGRRWLRGHWWQAILLDLAPVPLAYVRVWALVFLAEWSAQALGYQLPEMARFQRITVSTPCLSPEEAEHVEAPANALCRLG